MTADNATITFTISGKTADGSFFFLYENNNSFSKSRWEKRTAIISKCFLAQVMK